MLQIQPFKLQYKPSLNQIQPSQIYFFTFYDLIKNIKETLGTYS